MSETKQSYEVPGASKRETTERRAGSGYSNAEKNEIKSSTLAAHQKPRTTKSTAVGKANTIANAVHPADDYLYTALAMLDKLNAEFPGSVLKIANAPVNGDECIVIALPRSRWQFDKTGMPSWRGVSNA